MSYLKKLKLISTNISVLYVEDDETLRNSVEQYLKLIFNSVDCASNGQEGLEFFEKNPTISLSLIFKCLK